MAWTVELTEGSEPAIPLFYSATGLAMLEKGLIPFDPELKEWWGGVLENELVRSEYGKRSFPLKLQGSWSSVDNLIDAVNALQKRFLHARRFREDGWGDEVFLVLTPHNATYGVRFPVSSGVIAKDELMNACGLIMSGGHREAKKLVEIGITIVCGEPYWESPTTYSLENMCFNPGFWRGAAPGDSWTEDDVGGVLTLSWETSIWEVMGRSLKWVLAPDAVNYPGIHSDNLTVVASTAYYFECRGYSTAGCDEITAYVYDVTHAAPLAATTLEFDNQDDAWEKLGVTFTTPAGCVAVRITMNRDPLDSTAGNKTFYCDAFYLGPGTTAPVGWSSGRNLVNHLDDGADHLNVLCVTEIPGEVKAETRFKIDLSDNTKFLRVAKRTRNTPHDFIWHLTPCDAYTTAEGGAGGACTPGYTIASCIDSDKIIDATSPDGSRINVTFATTQTMALRCYWDILTDVTSYYGKFSLIVIAKMEGVTDTATIKVYETDEANSAGQIFSRTVSGTSWVLRDGWEVLSYRLGTSDDDLIDTGNSFRVMLYASTNGTPTDDLHIAGAYLVPIDEDHLVAGNANTTLAATTSYIILKHMDGDVGMFAHSSATNAYYANLGAVGTYPLLEPEIENWLYWIGTAGTGSTDAYTLDDAYAISLTYRPRGIFLRGSNP